jgi:hypothetical protein
MRKSKKSSTFFSSPFIMQLTKEKRNNKTFRLNLNPRQALNTAFISTDGSYWNGTWNVNFSSLMKEEDINRPYNVSVMIQSIHTDQIYDQIMNAAPVTYSILFDGPRVNALAPGVEYVPSACGLVTYNTLQNAGQAMTIVETTAEKNRPFYIQSLQGVTELNVRFLDVNNTIVNYGNPIMYMILVFEAADYVMGP